MCQASDGSWQLEGLLSHHSNCGTAKHPAIFTATRTLNTWILNTIGMSKTVKTSAPMITTEKTVTPEPSSSSEPSSEKDNNESSTPAAPEGPPASPVNDKKPQTAQINKDIIYAPGAATEAVEAPLLRDTITSTTLPSLSKQELLLQSTKSVGDSPGTNALDHSLSDKTNTAAETNANVNLPTAVGVSPTDGNSLDVSTSESFSAPSVAAPHAQPLIAGPSGRPRELLTSAHDTQAIPSLLREPSQKVNEHIPSQQDVESPKTLHQTDNTASQVTELPVGDPVKSSFLTSSPVESASPLISSLVKASSPSSLSSASEQELSQTSSSSPEHPSSSPLIAALFRHS